MKTDATNFSTAPRQIRQENSQPRAYQYRYLLLWNGLSFRQPWKVPRYCDKPNCLSKQDRWTDKETGQNRSRLYVKADRWQFTQYRRQEEHSPEATPTPEVDGKESKKGSKENQVALSTEPGVFEHPGNHTRKDNPKSLKS